MPIKKVFGKLKDVFDETALGALIDAGEQIGVRLKVKIYPTGSAAFRYPEEGHHRLKNKLDFGVAFSGGGTRSMSLSLGQMRALQLLGLDSKIKYIGCNSGGAWFATIYTYLPWSVSDEAWLGRHVDPKQLTPSLVTTEGGRHGILARQITRSEVIFLAFREMMRTALARLFNIKIPILNISLNPNDHSEVFGRVLEKIFLEEVGLAGERYVGWDPLYDILDIVVRSEDQKFGNPNFDFTEDFVGVEKEDRPFLLVSGAVNQDLLKLPDGSTKSVSSLSGFLAFDHFEFTPLYSGTHAHGRGKLGFNTGGGYVENIGFDTWLPVALPDNMIKVSPSVTSYRLTLKDIMATSGAAPAYLVHAGDRPALKKTIELLGALTFFLKLLNIFPKHRTWPVQFVGKPVTIERPFGDGGYVDNWGIIPLLKRRVKNLIVFINTSDEIRINSEWKEDIQLDKFLAVLFGISVPKEALGDLFAPSVFLGADRFLGAGSGKVFASGYTETVRGLLHTYRLANVPTRDGRPGPTGLLNRDDLERLNLMKGQKPEDYLDEKGDPKYVRGPTYHYGTYKTVSNSFFGIPGGDTVNILWVYNEKSLAWAEHLPASVADMLGKGVLDDFPRIDTFRGGGVDPDKSVWERLEEQVKENGVFEGVLGWAAQRWEFIDLHPEQVNLLANLSAWSVLQLRPIIENMLPGSTLLEGELPQASLRAVLSRANAETWQGAISAAKRRVGSGFPSAAMTSLRALADVAI